MAPGAAVGTVHAVLPPTAEVPVVALPEPPEVPPAPAAFAPDPVLLAVDAPPIGALLLLEALDLAPPEPPVCWLPDFVLAPPEDESSPPPPPSFPTFDLLVAAVPPVALVVFPDAPPDVDLPPSLDAALVAWPMPPLLEVEPAGSEEPQLKWANPKLKMEPYMDDARTSTSASGVTYNAHLHLNVIIGEGA